jgi:hypothetical protein
MRSMPSLARECNPQPSDFANVSLPSGSMKLEILETFDSDLASSILVFSSRVI